MKISLKSVIAAGLIVLSCTCTAVAAPTEESLINEVGQGNGFYTLYTGMPISDFLHNWKDIPGWEGKNNANGYSDYIQYSFQRSYEINGYAVKERVLVSTNEPERTVYYISWRISSPDSRLIDRISSKIQNKLIEIYPNAKTFPHHYLTGKQTPSFIRTGRGKEKLYFYNTCEYEGIPIERVSAYRLDVVYIQDPFER